MTSNFGKLRESSWIGLAREHITPQGSRSEYCAQHTEKKGPFIKPQHKTFAKYLIVGGSTALLELLIFQGLFHLSSGNVPLANITAVAIATGLNFLLNRNVTFQSASNPAVALAKYLFLFVFNTAFSTVVISLLVSYGIASILAKLLTMACIVCWNFVLYRKFVFK
ncbi:MAG: GtrA family protein [Eggerthellaceae bacterium]|jgi:putative flippase GtrA